MSQAGKLAAAVSALCPAFRRSTTLSAVFARGWKPSRTSFAVAGIVCFALGCAAIVQHDVGWNEYSHLAGAGVRSWHPDHRPLPPHDRRPGDLPPPFLLRQGARTWLLPDAGLPRGAGDPPRPAEGVQHDPPARAVRLHAAGADHDAARVPLPRTARRAQQRARRTDARIRDDAASVLDDAVLARVLDVPGFRRLLSPVAPTRNGNGGASR